jgi:hypothetical protein
MKQNQSWIIHIGAHKTGTTLLQDILEFQRENLSSQGLDYMPRREFRASKLMKTVMDQKFNPFSINWWHKKSFDFITRKIRSDNKNFLISEENILGNAGDLLCTPLYPQLERNISAWAELLNDNRVNVYLSIRNYASLLVSAYSHVIREGKIPLPIHDYYEYFLLNDRPNWCNVVDRVLHAWPNANLRVWSLEKFSEHKFEIIQRVTGCNLLRHELDIPKNTRTPSKRTIEKALGVDQSLARKVRKREIEELFAEDDFKNKFSPFSVKEIDYLDALYQIDLENIVRHHPGMLIDAEL